VFSRQYRGIARYLPRRLSSHIRLSAGKPMATADATLEGLFAEVLALRGDWR
jgi:hypothetical protein